MALKQNIEINMADGSRTSLSVFREEISETTNLLVLFPAMGVEAAYYQPFAESLALHGFLVITADLRGLGHSSIRPSKNLDYGYEEMIQLDYLAIFREINHRFPKHSKYVLGHSLGGQLASLFLSRHTFDIKGLILLASCSVDARGWEGLQRMRVLWAVYFFPLLAKLLGYFPGDKIGFGGKAAKGHLLDWSAQGQTGLYRPANTTFDYEVALKKLNLPTLAISIEGDQMAPAKAMKNLYSKFSPEATVEAVEFTKKAANNPKINHFNWARKPEKMIDLLIKWIDKD